MIATGAVRGGRRLRAAPVLLLLAGLLAWGPRPTPAAAAAAASGSPCSDPTGITVVVDFQGLAGRGVEVGCAAQPVDSGFDALQKAGFPPTPVNQKPALCRIDGQPESTCTQMPPTSAYWAYWYAPRGGSWCYATKGPSRKPPAGTVEGWSYSVGKTEATAPQPRYSPPPAIPGTTPSTVSSTCGSAPTTLPPPITEPPTPVTDPPAPGGGDAGGDDGGQPTDTTRPRSSGAATTTTMAIAPDGSVVDPSSTSSSSTAPARDQQAGGQMRIGDRDEGGGSPVGALVGGSAVALLGAAAAITARRRRRGEGGT